MIKKKLVREYLLSRLKCCRILVGWVERYTKMNDSNTMTDAKGLKTYLANLKFIVPFIISEHMYVWLHETAQLSIKLQGTCLVANILSSKD